MEPDVLRVRLRGPRRQSWWLRSRIVITAVTAVITAVTAAARGACAQQN
jgi:hypothetical protein